MYFGQHECKQTQTLYRWTEKFGQVPYHRDYFETLHVYTCEACEREHRVLEAASEPFYCTCGKLVGIETAS